MKKVSLGTVSCATMNPKDLIPAFIDELKYNEISMKSLGLVYPKRKKGYWESEDPNWDLDALFDALDNIAPAYCYFGSHPGDSSDYGFWISEEAIEDAIHDGDLLAVNDLSAVPKKYSEEVLVTNDHGNQTLYFMYKNGNVKEIWAIV